MSMLALIGFGCIGASAPLLRQHEDEFPRCAQIEKVEDAALPEWSVTMTDSRGRSWAIDTDLTLRECWRLKPRNSGIYSFSCEISP